MNLRADYFIAEGFSGALVIMDCLNGKSVTNDVEYVLQDMRKIYGDLTGIKIMYRDSSGIYDGINHNNGRFLSFFSINETDGNRAHHKLMQKQIQ